MNSVIPESIKGIYEEGSKSSSTTLRYTSFIATFRAAIYDGVVPQHPPTMLTKPSIANLRIF